MSVNHSDGSGGNNLDIFFIFFYMKVCCVVSIESSHRGDSNEYTQHTIITKKKENKKITRNCPNSIRCAAMGFLVRNSRTSSK